jgi:hypothetical protein
MGINCFNFKMDRVFLQTRLEQVFSIYFIKMTCPLNTLFYLFIYCNDKVGRNFIQKACASHMSFKKCVLHEK